MVAPRGRHVGGTPKTGNGAVVACTDPATGRTHGFVQWTTEAEAHAAVERSRFAFAAWSSLTPRERSLILTAVADQMVGDAECLAELECLDTGKPIAEARVDVKRATAGMLYYATLAELDQVSDRSPTSELAVTVRHEPIGVVAAIIPWNVPLVLTVCKAGAALAAGNTVIVKPASQTSLSALRLAELASAAGLPPDVLNVLPGAGGEIGTALVTDDHVNAVTFTGSTNVGCNIALSCAPTLKRVTLELGGKSPNIIFEDADLTVAAPAAAAAAFYGQGEICTAGSRLLIERSIYDTVVREIVRWTNALRVGDTLDPLTEYGSLISEAHLVEVLGGVTRALDEGGRLICGGSRLTGSAFDAGCFFAPTIIESSGPDSFLDQEEIFGPVLSVSPFDTEDEAIDRANNSRYGLAAGVWTEDLVRARRIARRLECGVVWLNTYNNFDCS
ncbi:MAG: aldehyde dehydrogenase family protein, partial [Acidimicrobiales bacterium]